MRLDKGVIAWHGIGQSELLWHVRGVPSVKRLREDLAHKRPGHEF
jgi:hypothetical protein